MIHTIRHHHHHYYYHHHYHHHHHRHHHRHHHNHRHIYHHYRHRHVIIIILSTSIDYPVTDMVIQLGNSNLSVIYNILQSIRSTISTIERENNSLQFIQCIRVYAMNYNPGDDDDDDDDENDNVNDEDGDEDR